MSSSCQLCRREYTASWQQSWYNPHENSGAENKNLQDKDILLWMGHPLLTLTRAFVYKLLSDGPGKAWELELVERLCYSK